MLIFGAPCFGLNLKDGGSIARGSFVFVTHWNLTPKYHPQHLYVWAPEPPMMMAVLSLCLPGSHRLTEVRYIEISAATVVPS